MNPDTQDDWELKQLAWSLQIDPAPYTIDELRAEVKKTLKPKNVKVNVKSALHTSSKSTSRPSK